MTHSFNQQHWEDSLFAFFRRQNVKQRTLQYFKSRPLNLRKWTSCTRNLRLQEINEEEFLKHCAGNSFAWKHARKLEGRENSSRLEGCYGISHKRADRYCGSLRNSDFKDEDSIDQVSPELVKYGKQFRTFAYFPVDDVTDFIELSRLGGVANCAIHINCDWYDPPNGVIDLPPPETIWTGTHSITPSFDAQSNTLKFRNSWGWEWGDEGSGSMSLEYFQKYVTEIEGVAGLWDQLPIHFDLDTAVGWKWVLSEKFSIHGREIIEGHTGERMAWAFATRQGTELVLHEFFVWPTYRSRGLAHRLAELVKELCSEARLNLRLRVPFADCDAAHINGVIAVAKMFGLELSESPNRFYCLDGVLTGRVSNSINIRQTPPPPAAAPLEWIRRKNDPPLAETVRVPVLFGTNRKVVISENETNIGSQRGGALTYGVQAVQVRNIQRFGSAGRTWLQSMADFYHWLRERFVEMKRDASEINLLEPKAFDDLSSFLTPADRDERRHLIFVHGFNTTFEFAMSQAARLKADLKLKGNIFVFSWPSAGDVKAYSSDEAAIEASYPYFAQFVERVKSAVGDEPLSVLAHSMGNRLLARLIDQASSTSERYRLRHAIFAAPDVDHDVFQHSIRSWKATFEHATLYANSADWALQLSEIKHKFPRAGLVPPLVKVEDLEAILVQGFDLFDLAHGYFAEAGNTLHDLFVLLKFDTPAGDRPGTHPSTLGTNIKCWTISHR